MKNSAILASLLALTLIIGTASAAPVSLSDDELSTEFAYEYGPGSVTITDTAGPGVQFDFTGLSSSSGTLVGDDFAVSAKAGGALKDYGSGFSTYGDFSGYDGYTMRFTNNDDTCGMNVNLKMNTGWTDSPWGTPARDTFWQGPWTYVGPGSTVTLTLDFSNAEAWNVADDPEYPGYTDGTTGLSVWRLDEVSDIGFQVLSDCDEISLTAEYVPQDVPPVPEFASLLVPMMIAIAVIGAAFVTKK